MSLGAKEIFARRFQWFFRGALLQICTQCLDVFVVDFHKIFRKIGDVNAVAIKFVDALLHAFDAHVVTVDEH